MRYWHPFTEEAISQVQRIKSPYPAKGTAISWEKSVEITPPAVAERSEILEQ
jgi:hypothetical protein